ncbi:hypothetical protein HRM2_04740 [Desulforapulum autotrophicum HRM2]|uniref:YkgJ family cysteine cluster protein n=1 Tax=Desulforapulum autotrophicum (strain ATCC 43914 / DSM 3382 / VKM B-1955 / HRM2) TaxID=177437 RepID=C0QHN0_DESAH|nr:hypothetical protein [Desulforapulum autotrophicum]ACN13588.1 hypothetical protein HRM2_04740 [Desulforapulum autotrophicum HRM2]
MERADERLERLSRLYALYDRFMGPKEFFCHRGCSTCCTCNVTLTTLEVDYIRCHLGPEGTEAIVERVRNNFSRKRFQPKITLNGFARACMAGRQVPDEENDPRWGTCPLLLDQVCTIYPVRPFGCRILVSTDDCSHTGVATLSEFTLTVNNVFMQYIEHMDCCGVYGNLSDMFLALSGDETEGLSVTIKNQEAKGFMVPPEHRQRIRPLLEEMTRI